MPVAALPTPTITTGTLASGDTASFTEAYSTKNVGTAKTLTPAGTVSDGNSGANYAVTFVTNTTGVISARAGRRSLSPRPHAVPALRWFLAGAMAAATQRDTRLPRTAPRVLPGWVSLTWLKYRERGYAPIPDSRWSKT